MKKKKDKEDNFVIDEQSMNPVKYAIEQGCYLKMNEVIDKVIHDSRDRDIIKMLYGIGFDKDGKKIKSYSLKELSSKFDVSKERIRQIEAKVIRTLRKPQNRKLLINACEEFKNENNRNL